MSLIARLARRTAIAFVVTVLAMGSALAQVSQLTMYVFDEGAPVSGIEVLIDDELVAVSDDAGLVQIDLQPGLHYIELRFDDSVVFGQQVLAVEDELSQWILDLTGGGSALYDVESSSPGAGAAAGAAAAAASNAAPGTIEGTLVSGDDGQPVQGARIFISGVSEDVRSDAQGRFSVQAPSGTRSISVLHSGFNTLTQDNIEVPEGGTANLDLELTPAGSEMPEFVVIAPYISGSLASVMAERRESEGVTDVLSSEQISRAGDSTAAGALRRITGLTLVDGQYIYVRGLGERYSSVTLNNAMIPSPDPTRRVVPLTLFPTDVIEAVVVQKTASAFLPGDFGGGTVQLRTVSFPPERTASLSFSIGYRDNTTGEDGLDYKGGDKDWLGYDDGARDVPDSLAEAIAGGEFLRPRSFTNPDGYTAEEIEVFGEDLAEKSTYDVLTKTLPPDFDLSGSYGDSFEFGDGNRWGFLTAFQYKNGWANVEEDRREYSAVGDGGLQLKNEVDVFRTLHLIDTGLFANAGVEFKENHKLGFNAMLLRLTEDETKITDGIEESQVLRRYRFRWVENELQSYQVVGSHTLPFKDWTIDWQYTDATASRWEPNTRNYRRDDDDRDGEYLVSTRPDNNDQSWSDLEDNLTNWGIDTTLPLDFGRNVLALRGGVGDLDRDRESVIRTFQFQGRIPNDLRTLDYSELFTPPYIGPKQLQLRETTRATDVYTAEQTLPYWFVNLDLTLLDGEYRISAGLREEDNYQVVVTNDLTNPNAEPVVGEIEQKDRLPSAAFTWAYSQNAQIRAAYAESVNRPDFREMSPAPYLDPVLDLITVGNPDLETAELKNYDLRWEYYFSPSESFSVALFYKDFTKPIEKTFSSSGSGSIITLQNALGAELKGVEVDYAQSLGWVEKVEWLDWLADLEWENYRIAFNYAWIDSTVDLDTDQTTQTNQSRPLQGQSPWVVNFQFGYYNPDNPNEWTLLFNKFGERISQAGVQGQPDIYEQPFPQLDFVYKRRFADNWRLTFKLKNLLDSTVEYTQGEETTREYKRGRAASLELQWSY